MHMQAEENRKAGKLYKKTASNMLWDYYPEMPISQHENMLAIGNYRQLEGFVEAEEYIMAAVDAVASWLKTNGIYLPKNIDQIVLFSDEPDAELAEYRDLCDIAHFANGEKGELAIEAVRAIHDLWVMHLTDHFFIEAEAYKLYRFMPLELVGYERVEYFHRTFLEPLLFTLNLSVDNVYVERVYASLQDVVFAQNGVRDKKSLCTMITGLDYYAMEYGIKHALEQDDRLVAKIAAQVIERNPVLRGE